MPSRILFLTEIARPGVLRRRRGGFLPFVAVTEVSVCLAIFSVLAAVLAFLPGVGDGSADAASAGDGNPIRRLELLGPDARRVAILSDDSCVVHEIEAPEAFPIWVRSGEERMTAIAANRADARLALGRSDGRIAVVDTESLETTWENPAAGAPISSAAFSPDGRTLAIGTSHGAVLLLDADTGDARHRFDVGGDVRAVGFALDGRHLVAPRADDSLSLRDATTAEEVQRIPTGQGQVVALAVSPHGQAVAVGTTRGEVWLHHLRPGDKALRLQNDLMPVLAVAFGPDDGWLAVGGAARSIRLHSADGSRSLGAFDAHRLGTRALVPLGDSLLSGGLDGRVVAWDIPTGNGRDLFMP